MKSYVIIPGRYPALTLIELTRILSLGNPYKLTWISADVIFLESAKDLPIKDITNRCAGIVKAGEVLSAVSDESVILDEIERVIRTDVIDKNPSGRIKFGISVVGDAPYVAQLVRERGRWNSQIKSLLAQINIKSGFLNSKDAQIPTVSVYGHKLLERGFELVIIAKNSKFYLAKTIAIQDVNGFIHRDMDRPFRDKRSGILPPKIARMMLNMTGLQAQGRILDPFCGGGTILMEGSLLGFNMVGSDISDAAVRQAQANLKWLYVELRKDSKEVPEVLLSDVRNIESLYKKNSMDAIVTEPYLGPPMHQAPSGEYLKSMISDSEKLYKEAAIGMSKVLKKDAPLVMVLPVYNDGSKYHPLEIINDFRLVGLRLESLVPVESYLPIRPLEKNRGTILIGDGHDFVLREIALFIKS